MKESAKLAEIYMNKKLLESKLGQDDDNAQAAEKMLVELDGCEIRVAVWQKDEGTNEKTRVYGNPKKKKVVNWRDVRIGMARPLDSNVKTYVTAAAGTVSHAVEQFKSGQLEEVNRPNVEGHWM